MSFLLVHICAASEGVAFHSIFHLPTSARTLSAANTTTAPASQPAALHWQSKLIYELKSGVIQMHLW